MAAKASLITALVAHLMQANAKNFQPMNVNYGLFPPLAAGGKKLPKRERNERIAQRALVALDAYGPGLESNRA